MYSVAPVLTPTQLPPTLVATPLPDTAGTLRVPPTDVAPSFSNEQVSNESRGPKNPTLRLPQSPQAAQAQAASSESPSYSNNPALGAPTNFLAQLISQDVSPQATIYLAQYEKLVYFANVKYKPSNAGKPVPQGLFAKFLQADPQPRSEIILPRIPAAIARVSESTGLGRPVQQEAATDNRSADIQVQAPVAYTPAPVILADRATKAYVATTERNDTLLVKAEAALSEQPLAIDF